MKKLMVGAIVALVFPPLIASAATLDELQAQLAQLMAQIAALQAQPGVAQTTTTTTTSCPNLTRNLSRNSRGADVTQLQNFLISQGQLEGGNSTGFYGALTEAAVQKFQCKHLSICSGTPSSSGYGAVGPRTRAAISQECSRLTSSTTSSQQGSVQSTSGQGSNSAVPNISYTPPMPTSAPEISVPPVIVGYWSVGNINTAGDYIAETAAESNIAMIPPDETGSVLPRTQKAAAHGLKTVLMVRDTIFTSHGGTLYPDYAARFSALWNSLGKLQESVAGFYLIDEPYINNAGAPLGQRLSEMQLKANLSEAITAIKRTAPGRPVMFTEGTTHVMRGDFGTLIPANLDYIGVNCYIYLDAGEGCSDAEVTQALQTLVSAMQPQQKLIITADGYIPNLPPGYSAFSDEVLRSRIIFWEHVLAPYIAGGKIGAFTPFIYQSVGDAISGLNEFPKSRTEMARYMQSLKKGSPTPTDATNLAFRSTITASGTYLDNTPERARDGSTVSGWNAGGFAPQWVRLDLGEAYRIAEMRLTVGQSPSGRTRHVVYASQTGESWVPLETFSGVTATNDVLRYSPTEPPYGIRYLKIETTESPSWVAWPEISITGY